MDDLYEDKEKQREKEANSSRDALKDDGQGGRKIANKPLKLVYDAISDFHPNNDSYVKRYLRVPSYNRELSVKSDCDIDDDNIAYEFDVSEFSPSNTAISTEEVDEINELANYLPTTEELTITPLNKRYKYWRDLKPKKCYSTKPIGDKSIYKDLQQVFKNVPPDELIQIINCLELFPYYQFYKSNGQLIPKEKNFIIQFKLTSEQSLLCYDIRKKILNRASYGILFLHDNKFFTVTNAYGEQKKSAVKGHSTLKSDGTWETPWETAVREVKEEIEYRSNEDHVWRPYDMTNHEQEFERLNYLECLFQGCEQNVYNRLIGLFIIRLKTSIEFRPRDKNEVLFCDWHPIEEQYDPSEFYTLDPFITHIRNRN